MSLNLAVIVGQSGVSFPTAPAQIHGDHLFTHGELLDRVRRFAATLKELRVRPGDKVAVMMPNRPEFTIAYFGILWAGGVVVPLNVLLVADEVAYMLADSDSVALVAWGPIEAARAGFERVAGCKHRIVAGATELPTGAIRFDDACQSAEAADVAQSMPDDTAVILYTSGTTGKPKGAELTHFNLYMNALCVSERQFTRWPRQVEVFGPGHVGLAVLPLYHSFGQTAIQNGMLLGGAAVRYVERFDAETALAAIERDRVTVFAGVPTMYFAILAVPDAERRYDLSSLRFCVSGGAALPIEVKRQFEQRFRVRIQEAYGLSETSPIACSQEIDRTAKAGSIGRPIWGVEMMIADSKGQRVPVGQPGEVLIRGHNIMKGYYKKPDATTEAMRGGWFHSGDIGLVDEEGDFFIVDRKKDLIIRGGFNVYPREVEEVLYRHPAVREAAVVGVADPKYGEEVKAVVALHAQQTVTADELVAYCKEHLAAYKYPRIVEIIGSLPKGPTGKILKRELRLEGRARGTRSLTLILPAAADSAKPNILLIYTDDQSYKTIGCYPESPDWVQTPHIDQLAADGVRFERAYLGAWCTPSRATMLTGRLPHAIESLRMEGVYPGMVYDPEQTPFWPAVFRQNGYQTAQIGKWHTGGDAGWDRDWDFQIVWNRPKWTDNAGAYFYGQKLTFHGKEREQLDEGYSTDNYTRWATEFIRGDGRQADKPWYLWLCYGAVHGPTTPAKRHDGSYADKTATLPSNVLGPRADKPKYLEQTQAWVADENGRPVLKAKPKRAGNFDQDEGGLPLERWIQQMNECARAIDDGVGELVAALKETGQLDNTIIIFTSDQGYAMGEHGLNMKLAPYDAAMASPLIVSWPEKFARGKIAKQPVNSADLVVTLSQLAGIEIPWATHGRDLTRVLQDPKTSWNHPMLMTFTGDKFGSDTSVIPAEGAMYHGVPWWVLLRQGKHKYVRYLIPYEIEELFDLESDPEELVNLAADPVYRELLDRLRGEAIDELRRTGAGFADAMPPTAAMSTAPAP